MCNFLLNRLSQIAVLMNKKTSKLLPTCTFFYVTRMRSGRMRTTRLLTVSSNAQRAGINGCRSPWMQNPLDVDPLDADPPVAEPLEVDPPCRLPQYSLLDEDPFLDAEPPATSGQKWQMLEKILPCPKLRAVIMTDTARPAKWQPSC